MNYKGEILSVLILISSCGDDGPVTTGATSTGPTTQPGTSGPASSTTTEGTSSTGGVTSMATAPTTGITTGADGGPVFLSFNTNVSKITEGESVVFTALLTDPDGVEDIIGGSLLSDDESIDFGPFVAAGQEGSYSISLSWEQVHQADPITFENTELTRVFRARFFDQAGHPAVEKVEIGLSCPGGSACNGACTDLAVDGANCGSCGHACESMTCDGNACGAIWSGCFSNDDGLDTCSAICQSIGENCAENGCGGTTVRLYVTTPDCEAGIAGNSAPQACDHVQSWANPAIKCCCTDSN